MKKILIELHKCPYPHDHCVAKAHTEILSLLPDKIKAEEIPDIETRRDAYFYNKGIQVCKEALK